MDRMLIAQRLRELRADRKSCEVAKACGISKSALAMYEAGCRIPRDEIKVKIANFYGTSVGAIFFLQTKFT